MQHLKYYATARFFFKTISTLQAPKQAVGLHHFRCDKGSNIFSANNQKRWPLVNLWINDLKWWKEITSHRQLWYFIRRWASQTHTHHTVNVSAKERWQSQSHHHSSSPLQITTSSWTLRQCDPGDPSSSCAGRAHAACTHTSSRVKQNRKTYHSLKITMQPGMVEVS